MASLGASLAQPLVPNGSSQENGMAARDLQVYFDQVVAGQRGEPLTRDSEDCKCSGDLRRERGGSSSLRGKRRAGSATISSAPSTSCWASSGMEKGSPPPCFSGSGSGSRRSRLRSSAPSPASPRP